MWKKQANDKNKQKINFVTLGAFIVRIHADIDTEQTTSHFQPENLSIKVNQNLQQNSITCQFTHSKEYLQATTAPAKLGRKIWETVELVEIVESQNVKSEFKKVLCLPGNHFHSHVFFLRVILTQCCRCRLFLVVGGLLGDHWKLSWTSCPTCWRRCQDPQWWRVGWGTYWFERTDHDHPQCLEYEESLVFLKGFSLQKTFPAELCSSSRLPLSENYPLTGAGTDGGEEHVGGEGHHPEPSVARWIHSCHLVAFCHDDASFFAWHGWCQRV